MRSAVSSRTDTSPAAIVNDTRVVGTNKWGRAQEGVLEAEWLLVSTRFGTERYSRFSAPAAPEGTEWPVVYELTFSFKAPNVTALLHSSATYTLSQLELA